MTARDLPPVLGKLIPRLSTPFDAERLATVIAIERALRSEKLDWHDLACAAVAQAGLPRSTCKATDGAPPRWADLDGEERLQWLAALASEPGLNHWSRSFADSIAAQVRSGCRLSPKQLGCVDKILAAAWRRGVRPDARQRP